MLAVTELNQDGEYLGVNCIFLSTFPILNIFVIKIKNYSKYPSI